MLDKQIQQSLRPATNAIARLLVRFPLNPDDVSWAGLGFGFLACLFAAYHFMATAIVFIALNRLCDLLDGAIARVKPEIDPNWRHHESRGKFLDIVCDTLFFAAFPLAVAIGIHTQTAYLSASLLLFAQIALGATSLAYGLMVADRPAVKPQSFSLHNLAEGLEMLVYVVLITLMPAEAFPWLTIPFALFCMVSAGARIKQAYTTVG